MRNKEETQSDMEELKVFTYNYVEELRRRVEKDDDYSDYLKESFPYKEIYPKGRTGVFLPSDFELHNPETQDNFDLENSINLYENLSGMNPTIASDVRLWTYLVHVRFWRYMQKRWSIEEKENHPENRVLNRYHIKYLNIESLTRNGISRLWWFAYLTVDPRRNDKYELTRILLSRADLTASLMERSMGSNQNIRTAILEFLGENEDIRVSEALTRGLIKNLNLLGGVKNLPYMNIPDLKSLLGEIKKNILLS